MPHDAVQSLIVSRILNLRERRKSLEGEIAEQKRRIDTIQSGIEDIETQIQELQQSAKTLSLEITE